MERRLRVVPFLGTRNPAPVPIEWAHKFAHMWQNVLWIDGLVQAQMRSCAVDAFPLAWRRLIVRHVAWMSACDALAERVEVDVCALIESMESKTDRGRRAVSIGGGMRESLERDDEVSDWMHEHNVLILEWIRLCIPTTWESPNGAHGEAPLPLPTRPPLPRFMPATCTLPIAETYTHGAFGAVSCVASMASIASIASLGSYASLSSLSSECGDGDCASPTIGVEEGLILVADMRVLVEQLIRLRRQCASVTPTLACFTASAFRDECSSGAPPSTPVIAEASCRRAQRRRRSRHKSAWTNAIRKLRDAFIELVPRDDENAQHI